MFSSILKSRILVAPLIMVNFPKVAIEQNMYVDVNFLSAWPPRLRQPLDGIAVMLQGLKIWGASSKSGNKIRGGVCLSAPPPPLPSACNMHGMHGNRDYRSRWKVA